ncbi:MAG: universal stress protein [Syntrophaceae bacterium]|nr:universal stress protein [Syntrophaceae bacterium]
MFQPKTILVPTDFSVYSERAFRKALDLSKAYSAKLAVLHVVRVLPLNVGEYWLEETTIKRVQADLERASRDEVVKFIGKFPEAKGLSVEASVRSGVPYEQIVQDAADRGVDLIVMAPRGKAGIKEHLLGGTADRVIRHAACDVLIVRGRD